MALRKIVYVPDPVLRRKAHKVTDFGPEFQALVTDMVDTMREAPGVGLAAPQVGVSLRLVVIEYGDEDDEDAPKQLFTIANPEIVQTGDTKVFGIEACLSVPDLAGEVERFEEITVKAFNRRGQPVKIKAEFGDRLAFWGGGVDTQRTLPFGTPDEVRREVLERIGILNRGGGYVFNPIHNVVANVPPENLIAMYQAVRNYGIK